ncbi:ribonuclease T2 [Neocallimastix lanati (nom. inval.)]|jgi:ribonuclease I|nr:ribonuclease T2 [Neocallimastix sp. JGI-2020a]
MKYILTVLSTLIFTIQAYGKAFNSQILLTNSVKDFECPSFDVVACSENQDLVNKCCVPDQGHLVLSLQWLPSYCKNAGRNKPCKKGTLKKVEKDTWTLHGLWPGNCDGRTYLTNCNPQREEENIEEVIRSKDKDLLSEMEKIWLSGNPDPLKDNNWFWAHEWNKHGQCVSTITPQCMGANYKKNDDIISYFEKAVELRSLYDLYPILENAEIVPNDKDGYYLDTLQSAFRNAFNNTQVEINCVYNKREKRQYMSEVRLCFHAKNAFEVEGPINCINASSRCNPKYKVFYAVNPTKPKIPKNPENDNNFYINEEDSDEEYYYNEENDEYHDNYEEDDDDNNFDIDDNYDFSDLDEEFKLNDIDDSYPKFFNLYEDDD